MKSFSTILVVLGTVALASAAFEITRGVKISTRGDPPTPVVCAAGDSGNKCSSCNTYLICVGENQLGNDTCKTPNAFCDPATDACTAETPETCKAPGTSSFTCPEEGFFPNPNDCQTYFFCDADKISEQWSCPDNYVYDALNGFCKRKVYATDCVVMKCTTTPSVLVHKTNPSLWAFCDSGLNPILFKCPNNMVYDAGCRYVCKAEGTFAGKNSAEAYVCARSGTTWKITVMTCPSEYEYNAKFSCVKKTTTA